VKKANRLLQLDEDEARQNYEQDLFNGGDERETRGGEDDDYNNVFDDNENDE